MNIQLTQHFNLDEFTRSGTAAALGIDNRLHADHDNATMTDDHDNEVIENLRNLCTQVLEPLREFLGVPVLITSGYRCPELNKAVGGVANSQHLVGEAADIAISDKPISDKPMIANHESRIANRLKEAFLFVQNNCSFDQLILETKNGRSWIHVSCCRDQQRNRQTSMTISDKSISDKR